MKKLILTLSILGLMGCETQHEQAMNADSEFKFKCVPVGHGMYRCENKEAICYSSFFYMSHPAAAECKFKNL